jgi:transcriptional regulator of aromatic amino acid metabolism
MRAVCVICESNIDNEKRLNFLVSCGVCESCAKRFNTETDKETLKELIENIDAPILLMQPEPRQVYTANNKALELFTKTLSQIEGHRGGQVFDCIHSFSEAGCGKDENCENCKIKNAVVETFTTGNSIENISTDLQIVKNDKTSTYNLSASTEKVGSLELLRIEQYKKE